MLGHDLLIAIDGRVIAAQQTCELDMTQDTIEVCSPVSGPWRDYRPSTLGWQIACSGLIVAPEMADEVIDILTSRRKLRLTYYDTSLRCMRSGYALPTNLKEGASVKELANYSFQFLGCGSLERVLWHSIALDSLTYASQADRGYSYTNKENHPVIVMGKVAKSVMRAYQLNLEQVARVRYTHGVVYGKTEALRLIDAFDKTKNIYLYQHEIDHNLDVSPKEILLPAGTYYFVTNFLEPIGVQMEISVLSLPVE